MKVLERFDLWVESGPFNSADAGIYRIIYATLTLCVVPSIGWLANYPDFFYQAPLGPFQLLNGYPPLVVLTVLEILRSLALVLLGFGLWTRVVSIAVAALLLVTYGLTYTLGKIDHTILLIIIPLVLAFSNWGDRFSVDALLKNPKPKSTPQWPFRYLALAIGLSFFVAAAIKLGTGWLAPSSQAVRGQFYEYLLARDRPFGLAEWVVGLNVTPAWEILDWATVVLEFAMLATVPWWRAFRTALACAAIFHLSVYLCLDIAFTHNLIAYGAFISWGVLVARVRGRLSPSEYAGEMSSDVEERPPAARVLVATFVTAVAISIGAWQLTANFGVLASLVNLLVIVGGAMIGIVYLTNQVVVCARYLVGSASKGSPSGIEISN
ncbi:HTTM domain-containing protein [Mycolicibacterium holsaticum]|uniref:HTTM domain-containing protein n=1 Tax=Mycolicibacterium holsaticum TaxID=152142 RepID=UPI000DA14BF2|nr:HTTM domain-containing protein [Mycolicibacterium holsaticum]